MAPFLFSVNPFTTFREKKIYIFGTLGYANCYKLLINTGAFFSNHNAYRT